MVQTTSGRLAIVCLSFLLQPSVTPLAAQAPSSRTHAAKQPSVQQLQEGLTVALVLSNNIKAPASELEEKIKELDAAIEKLKAVAAKIQAVEQKLQDILPQFLAMIGADAAASPPCSIGRTEPALGRLQPLRHAILSVGRPIAPRRTAVQSSLSRFSADEITCLTTWAKSTLRRIAAETGETELCPRCR